MKAFLKSSFSEEKKNTKPSGQHAAQWCEMAKKGVTKSDCKFLLQKRNQEEKNPLISLLH